MLKFVSMRLSWLLAFVALPLAAQGTDLIVVIKNHRFEPATITVPAGKAITLTVDNRDSTPEEFESHPLHVEKVIPGNSKGVVRFGPLEPGQYPFVGEFHEATAKGVVVAK
jgi:plastocyanin